MLLFCSHLPGVLMSHTLNPRILILTKIFFPSLTFQSWPYSVASKDLLKYTTAFPLKIFALFLLSACSSLQSLMAHSDTFRFLIREAFPDLSKIIVGPPVSLAFPFSLTLPCFLSPHFILHIVCLVVCHLCILQLNVSFIKGESIYFVYPQSSAWPSTP